MIETATTTTDMLVQRRKWLEGKVRVCPACGEEHKIQLVYWLMAPAEWKCRKCKYSFCYEPISNVEVSRPREASAETSTAVPRSAAP